MFLNKACYIVVLIQVVITTGQGEGYTLTISYLTYSRNKNVFN